MPGPTDERNPAQFVTELVAGDAARQPPIPPPTPPLLPSVPGYELLEELDRGGMGVVYKARQLGFNRLVALKMILSGSHAGAEERERFRAEAEAVARLQHPNIVQVHEVGEHEGKPFFSMEFCPGGGLDRKLNATPLPPADAARLVETLARAVQAAHDKGVIHRDLKPANVLLAEDGTPKVTDFGLAKRMDMAGRTQSGDFLGTPSYAAPEQATGKTKEIGPPTDVYALGAILYTCLTGRPPFKAATALDTLAQVMADDPVPPRRLQPKTPRDLDTICLKCLEKSAGRRYPTARDMAEDLRRFLTDEPVRARPVGLVERGWKWAQRRPAPAAVFGLLLIVFFLLMGYGVERFWRQREQETADRRARAAALVHSLRTADTGEVPALLDALPGLGADAWPLLREALRQGPLEPREELHIRLGLLQFDPEQAEGLVAQLPDLPPNQLLVVREALAPYKEPFTDGLWRLLEDPQADAGRRLRAAGALATFDPDSPRWSATADSLADWIVAESLLDAAHWVEAFRPIRSVLRPPLTALFQDPQRRESERDLAASLLADYARDQPAVLADLAVAADAHQLNLLWPSILAQRLQIVPLLAAGLDQDATRPGAAGRKAASAVVLARLGEWDPIWPLLKSSPRPGVRSWLIHRLAPGGVDPAVLATRYANELDPSARAALLLALGECSERQFPNKDREALLPALVRSYRDDPAADVHGAIAWLVRQRWGKGPLLDSVDEELAGKDPGSRRWMVNRQGRTFALVQGPVIFGMGSPADELDREEDLEYQHRCRIPRGYALAAREVTVAEYLRFRPDFKYRRQYSRDPEAPIINVTWYDAVAYCRWLSEKEGVPEGEMCYPPLDQIKAGMTLPADCLERTGYRLPTEAEWEYACRAGAETSRCYGDDAELLAQYAWYSANSGDHTHPGAVLKPNDFGVFDMLGNAWEWCQDRQRTYVPGGDAEDGDRDALVRETDPRVLRGGAFGWHAGLIRSARRNAQVPSYNYHLYGFRMARTLPGALRRWGPIAEENPAMITKVVSGGQTGVDRAALDLALELGIPCGGWCPKGRKAEDGTLPERYPLKETETDVYAERTEANVRDADGTLILVRGPVEGGTRLTLDLASRYSKPNLVVDLAQASNLAVIKDWVRSNNIHVLNVAGPRESEAAGVYNQARTLLRQFLALRGVIAS